MRHPFWGRNEGGQARQTDYFISCWRLRHTIKFKMLASFFFLHSTNGTANWISRQLMSYSSMSLHAWAVIAIIWTHLNINITLTNTRLYVAHTLAGWNFKSTKIKIQITFNQTAHISLNHLENAAVGSFQCTPASLYLSLRAEFCPALCAIAHTYGF